MGPVMAVRSQTRYRTGVKIGRGLWVWCPGCDEPHRPQIAGEDGDRPDGACWDWNGDLEKPTLSPSLLVYGKKRCHSFIRDGHWEFLADCAHSLAGQTVPMVPLPDWLAR